ncbi:MULTISPECIES: hypothetical protein [Bacillus]|uniref:hypothetical protein n=2 Tax=Bacillaceae TaxID=186817 RepID=UPI00062DAD5B|nr:hypothetical protein [Bacillus cereus]KLA22692.1 hypothetical protein B4080_5563 [Bacillus cereus]
MISLIRDIINKLNGTNNQEDPIFCSKNDEKIILKYLANLEDPIKPFNYKNTDEKGKEFLEFIVKYTWNTLISFNKNVEGNKQKKCYFFFVNDRSINAFATRYNDIDIVGINIGVPEKLYDYFDQVIDDTIFPEIAGNNELRKDLIFNLQVFSIIYILFHEFGHIYNGHIDYDELKYLQMFADNSSLKYLHSKTIEMDADAFAINRAYEFIESLIAIRSKEDKPYNVREFSYKSLMFAVYSFYLFFEDIIDVNNLSKKYYFPSKLRQMFNITIIEQLVEKNHNYFLEKLYTINDETALQCEECWGKYTNTPFNPTSILLLQSKKVKEDIHKVHLHWNQIRDELQDVARLPLAPKYNI